MLLGIAGTTPVAALTGVAVWAPRPYSPQALAGTWMQLDLRGTLPLGFLEIVFVFLFGDLFDNIGTPVAVTERAGLMDAAGRIPRVGRILTADSLATITAAPAGTSTVVSYIESATGVVAGGRSGLPVAATAPAPILVGAFMISHTGEIEWGNPRTALPAFLTMLTIPLTFSIANGLAFRLVSYTVLHVLTGQARRVSWLVYVLTGLFCLRFAYLARVL
jgi:AGZA family xanthine/uracil permease-like MFS transporter